VLPTSWDGEPVARLCFVHPETTKQLVDEVMSTIDPAVDRVQRYDAAHR
jgi:hypothetical protein